jgi:chromosome segregation ATPase
MTSEQEHALNQYVVHTGTRCNPFARKIASSPAAAENNDEQKYKEYERQIQELKDQLKAKDNEIRELKKNVQDKDIEIKQLRNIDEDAIKKKEELSKQLQEIRESQKKMAPVAPARYYMRKEYHQDY